MSMQSLNGKFVIRNDENGYRTGQIEDVTDDVVLVRFDNMRPEVGDPSFVFPMELVSLAERAGILRDLSGAGQTN